MHWNRIGRAPWLAPALLVLGCGAGAGPSAEGDLRSAYDAAADANAHERAGDERALAGPVLDRTAFVQAVLDRNPSIESARQAWRAAVARVSQAGVLDDPMATVDMAPLTLGSSKTRFAWEAMISQKLPWPGKLSLDEAVASAEADAARSDFEAARTELALTAALLFDQYFVAARAIEVNTHHVELMRDMRAAAASQYATGRGSAQDPLQAEFELAHMEHDAVVVASQRDVIVAQMNELLHRAPREALPPPPASLLTSSAPDRLTADPLDDNAFAHRPDIAAARARARSEQARAERAGREAAPDITVSTAYSTMWDVPEQRWTVGLTFNLPVQGGRRAGAVDEAHAMRAQFESEAARLRDAARTQAFTAQQQLEESEHVLHLYEERLVPIARRQVDAARAAFMTSQVPFGSVVDAEKNLRSVELEMQMASADADRRRAELDHALGRVPGTSEKAVTP